MSAGWSWAFDTPFTWFKQNASKLGGIRQGMCISWPGYIKDVGALRDQFCHVIDVVPTLLDVCGIAASDYVDGNKQSPIEGTSFAYTFDEKNAKEPSRHKTQYFEMMGQWALYHEGWLLSTQVNRAPWQAFGEANPDPLNNQVLELYDLNKDFSQSQNVADKYPDKVKEMKTLFIEEARKYQVFPTGCLGRGPHRRATSKHHRRAHGVRLHLADDRSPAGRFSIPAQQLLHHHGRY